MRCPECKTEYDAGMVACGDCGASLGGDAADEDIATVDISPVVVFESGHPDRIAIAKSMLMSSGIEYMVTGEHVQDLFGYGRFPAASNLVVGPVQVLVAAADRDDATAILGELEFSASDTEAMSSSPTEVPEASRSWRAMHTVAKIGIMLMLASVALSVAWSLIDILSPG
jgi:hypothetical protein